MTEKSVDTGRIYCRHFEGFEMRRVCDVMYLTVGFLQVTLVSVEDNRLFLVVFAHHFQCDTGDSRLEIGLFSIYHNAYIQLFSSLEERWLPTIKISLE